MLLMETDEIRMIALDMTTILGNTRRPWFLVHLLKIRREAASEFFSVAPAVAEEPGLGMADYWAVQFECGLKIGFEFFHSSEGAYVYADLPCPQHVRRHLRHWHSNLQDIPREWQEPDRTAMIEQFSHQMPELLELEAYQVWRQGDDGNPIPVGVPTTKRDAECWLAELESHLHKQSYWVSRRGEAII
ncbi:MAG TPA: hypothetical protein VHC19_27565 [Pirellulales bacterium]|nr:hypothetical protein [Pirellulales bacterium]